MVTMVRSVSSSDDDADDCAEHFALPAVKTGAADHDGCDDLEFQTLARVGRHSAKAREAYDARERSGETDDHQALNLDPIGADAGFR